MLYTCTIPSARKRRIKNNPALTSMGTLLALAALMMFARARLAFGSGEPPVLTAMIIFFPNTAFVLALAASVFPFVAARTAAARPMNSWKLFGLTVLLLDVAVVGDGHVVFLVTPNGENASTTTVFKPPKQFKRQTDRTTNRPTAALETLYGDFAMVTVVENERKSWLWKIMLSTDPQNNNKKEGIRDEWMMVTVTFSVQGSHNFLRLGLNI